MNSAAEWKLDDNRARLSVGPLAAVVDLAAPQRGLHQVTFAEQSLVGCELLGVEFGSTPPALIESYQRGGDLIASFAETPSAAASTQVYWRAALLRMNDAICPAIDLEISVQTSRLENRPVVRTRSRLPAGDMAGFATLPPAQSVAGELFEHGIVFHPSGWSESYVEMVQPSGAEASQINKPNETTTEISHWLFECELEKGVILRARARGMFVPYSDEMRFAAAAWLQFLAEPPPLTT